MQLVQHKKLLIKGDTTVGKQLASCSVAKEIAPKEWPRSVVVVSVYDVTSKMLGICKT